MLTAFHPRKLSISSVYITVNKMNTVYNIYSTTTYLDDEFKIIYLLSHGTNKASTCKSWVISFPDTGTFGTGEYDREMSISLHKRIIVTNLRGN